MTFVITNIKEEDLVRRIAANFARHPLQVNGLMEADAEIIRQPANAEEYLVLKTDSIHEEIRYKLYEDPCLIGWMAVTAPVSDMAAAGATPEGILLSLILPRDAGDEWLTGFKKGISDACAHYGIYVIGGDTSFDHFFSVSATVVGHAKREEAMLRKQINPGDYLYITSRPGVGNAYAYSRFFDPSLEISFRPIARLKESSIIRRYATACIDTSDGLFPGLAVMWEVNQAGFSLDVPLLQLLSPEALEVHRQATLPEWMLLAGPHGEYELLFTVPAGKQQEFQNACTEEGWEPVYLGRAIPQQELDFISGNMQVQCHPALVADLFHEAGGNVSGYLELLMKQHKTWNTKI